MQLVYSFTTYGVVIRWNMPWDLEWIRSADENSSANEANLRGKLCQFVVKVTALISSEVQAGLGGNRR